LSPRRRQNAARKAELILKAGELFWKNGFENTSMREIAKLCGYEPANIYNYFENKEQLLYEVLYDDTIRAIQPIREFENDNTVNPLDQLRMVIKNDIVTVLGSPKRKASMMVFDFEIRNLTREHKRKIIQLRDMHDRIVFKIIGRGIERGDFRDIDPKLVGISIISIILRSRIWFKNKRDKGVTMEQFADFVFDFVVKGLISKSLEPK